LFFLSQKKILNRRSMQAADKDQSARGYIRSEGDLFLNDAKQHAADASEPADAAGDDDPWDFQVQDSYEFCRFRSRQTFPLRKTQSALLMTPPEMRPTAILYSTFFSLSFSAKEDST
jgi:hypothetical protein